MIPASTPTAESQRYGQQSHRHDQRPTGHAQRQTPPVGVRDAGSFPQTLAIPEPLPAVDRREDRAERTDAAPGREVDAYTGFVKRAQNTGVIRACRTGTGEDDGGAETGRVGRGLPGAESEVSTLSREL